MSPLSYLHNLVPLGVVGFLIWGLWIYRFWVSHRCRPVENDFTTTTSVVVPSYREDPEILLLSLSTWLEANPTEVLIVVDVADRACIDALADFDHPALKVIEFKHQGKRSALGVGIRAATSEIIVLSDSDTFWRPGLLAAVQMPFVDPTVGAVGTQQNVYQRTSSVWRRIADWMLNLRYYDYVPIMGKEGALICVSGRTAAYRRSVVLEVLPDLEDEFFLGKRCVAGDDGRLTWLILSKGYQTVHQSSAMAYSMFPNTFRAFVKQRLRWYRNSARTYLTAAWRGWLWQTPLISQFTAIQVLLTAFTMWFSFEYLVTDSTNWLPTTLLAAFGWILLGRFIKSYSHLKRYPRDIVLLPMYCLVVIFLALPLKAYALITMNKQGWLTRSDGSIGGEGQRASSLLPDIS